MSRDPSIAVAATEAPEQPTTVVKALALDVVGRDITKQPHCKGYSNTVST